MKSSGSEFNGVFMPIPDFQRLMLPVLKSAVDGKQILGKLRRASPADIKLTEEEREQRLPSGRQTTRSSFRITERGKQFERKWIEQCAAARRVKEHFGLAAALDYLIGEKLLTFAGVAELSTEFMQELSDFLQEIRARLPSGRNWRIRRAARTNKATQPPSA